VHICFNMSTPLSNKQKFLVLPVEERKDILLTLGTKRGSKPSRLGERCLGLLGSRHAIQGSGCISYGIQGWSLSIEVPEWLIEHTPDLRIRLAGLVAHRMGMLLR
jgi:hypothetical protein